MPTLVHSQIGFANMADPCATQAEPAAASCIPLSLTAQKYTLEFFAVYFDSSGVPVSGVDRGSFTLKLWERRTLPTGQNVFIDGISISACQAYRKLVEYETLPGTLAGVVVTNIVAPATAASFSIYAKRVVP